MEKGCISGWKMAMEGRTNGVNYMTKIARPAARGDLGANEPYGHTMQLLLNLTMDCGFDPL